MTVKVMLLKSGEDVISDAQEVRDKEGNSIVAYYLRNPYSMQLTTTPVEPEEEDDELIPDDDLEGQARVKIQVSYQHWAPLSKQRDFYIPADWVITLYDAHDNIYNDYTAKHPPVSDEDAPTEPKVETDGTETNSPE